jgi:hypothetical protein
MKMKVWEDPISLWTSSRQGMCCITSFDHFVNNYGPYLLKVYIKPLGIKPQEIRLCLNEIFRVRPFALMMGFICC